MDDRTTEKLLSILRDITQRARKASGPLEALEETINIEELGGQAISLIRSVRK